MKVAPTNGRLRTDTQPRSAHAASPHNMSPHNMMWIPGGTFRMGSDRHYPEEAPAHRVTVDTFWIDRTPVTNREFRKFANATGYVTFAEIKPDVKDYPGPLSPLVTARSLALTRRKHPVATRDWSTGWSINFDATWRRHYGPRFWISGRKLPPLMAI